MRVQAVEMVLSSLGSYDPHPRLNSRGDWGSASCPLAPWTHGGGRDRNPSMMVSCEPGPSAVKCMSCGFTSGMLGLVNEVHRYGGIDKDTVDELRYLIILEETRHYEMLEKEGMRPEVPASYVRDLGQWHPYWEERNISRREIRDWHLGYSAEEKRALIPFFTMDGSLVGVVGRDVTGFSPAKYKVMPSGFDRAHYLFGEHRVTGKEPKLLIVEGYLDAITTSRYLPDDVAVVALGSASPSKEQMRRIAMLTNEEAIIGLDDDEAGQRGAIKLQRNLAGRAKLSRLDYGDHKDADEAAEKITEILENRTSTLYAPAIDRLRGML